MLTKASVPPSTVQGSRARDDHPGGGGSPRRTAGVLGWRRFRPQPAAAVVVAALTGAALLAGCGTPGPNGEAGKAAGQILADAQKATMTARSVHVSGSGSTTTTPLRLDVVSGPGRGGGTITSGSTVLNLILDKQSIYIKADASTIQSLTGNAATASSEANRWLETSSSNSSLTGLSQLLDIGKLPQSFTFGGVPTKQAATTFAGVAVIPLLDPKNGGTLFVATTGKPYIIGIRGPKSSGGATLTLDQYGTAKVPSAPPNPITLPNAPG